jgi:hypothetical protein
MRLCSSCAGGLPAEAATWDISNLVIDGQPVQRSTVIAWLDTCYVTMYDRPYEEPKQHRQSVMAATQLYQLLAFADAVGSTRGVIRECVADLDKVRVQVTLGQQVGQLVLDSAPSYFERSRSNYDLTPPQAYLCQGQSSVPNFRVAPEHANEIVSSNANSNAAADVAAQLEQLLFIAHKLKLQELLQRVQAFITAAAAAAAVQPPHHDSCSAVYWRPLLPSSLLGPAVYSARVCDAAGYTQEQAAAALASKLHQVHLLGIANVKQRPILHLLDAKPAVFEFKAVEREQGIAGIASDSHVDVVLCLVGPAGAPTLKITTTTSSSSSSRTNSQTTAASMSAIPSLLISLQAMHKCPGVRLGGNIMLFFCVLVSWGRAALHGFAVASS